MTIDIIISNLEKKYSIPKEKSRTIFERLKNIMMPGNGNSKFYALKEVNIKICRGEFVGLIGENGSGKSTLLKIMSGILVPTKGKIQIYRKIIPILDLGVGFQEELTGRENIYLYGAIMGLKRKDIRKKFDEIVRFADVEKFIDAKLRKFSSGMRIRLAFSTMIQANPQILLLDEIFAVGDKEFQEKCCNVFRHLHSKGKTIILSSHDMDVIRRFCTRTIYLKEGRVVMFDRTQRVIERYYKDCHQTRDYMKNQQ